MSVMDDLFDSLISAALQPAASKPAAPRKRAAAVKETGPTLRTERLKLRPLEASDAPDFHRLINDWDICRKLPDAPFPYPKELAADWIAAAAADRAAGAAQQFAIVLAASNKLGFAEDSKIGFAEDSKIGFAEDSKIGFAEDAKLGCAGDAKIGFAEGAMIGCAGLRNARDGKTAELGYWIGRKFWRQGFGLEAAARLTAWGLAELRIGSVTATVAEDNDASISVLRRAGFSQTGKGKQAFQCRAGAKLPVLHFAAFRETPQPQPEIAYEILLVAACALIDTDGRILLARRPEGRKMAGLWEFPGGKLNPNETPEAALVRELKEELGIVVEEKNLAPFAFASHAYDGFHLLMPLYFCRRWHGRPSPKEGQALAWVAPDRLVEYPMPAADRPLIPILRDFL